MTSTGYVPSVAEEKTQLADEMKSLSREEKEKLLSEAKLPILIPTDMLWHLKQTNPSHGTN